MSRLKSRPMPTFQDLFKQQSVRPDGEGEGQVTKTEQSPEKEMTVAVDQEKMIVADAAFCRQCGEWLTSEHISLGITFRCPKCNFSLFSINRIGAREKWEKNNERKT